METAWKTAAVDPVMVVMRSGQEPSEMVIRALLCGDTQRQAVGLLLHFLARNLSACRPTRPQPTPGNNYLPRVLITHPKWWGAGKKVGQGSPLPSKPDALGSSPKLQPHLLPDSLYSLSFLWEKNTEWLLAGAVTTS